VYATLNVDVGYVTSYTVTGLAPGNTYYSAVSASDLNGMESGLSNEVFAIK
jgi:fibronectin type 3 domain-containing protein